MGTSSIRILVAEDFEPFRRFLLSTLRNTWDEKYIQAVSGGLEAVRWAQELKPDVILLDIGLPGLNGIEAARQIRRFSPKSKILFVSQESSAEVVQHAFSLGACGYVVKMDAGRELLVAVDAVLRGERFVGSRFTGHHFAGTSDTGTPQIIRRDKVLTSLQRHDISATRRHEATFYSDDESFMEGFTQFIGAALRTGNAVITVATESHRDNLLPRLQTHGLDIGAAIEQGRYIALDAAETLSTFMVNDMPDPVRFMKVASDLIAGAAKAARGEQPRVAACGECAPLLWAHGNAEAAIRVEHLWDEIGRTYDVDILCGYPLGGFHGVLGSRIFPRICAVHSAVHSS
ncbi:MAG TPA: response regulator [Candidatus Sulfotelmatobacter sp.]|nr:response regulator [Candidatus Sulfotelmatobacter sp.]